MRAAETLGNYFDCQISAQLLNSSIYHLNINNILCVPNKVVCKNAVSSIINFWDFSV